MINNWSNEHLKATTISKLTYWCHAGPAGPIITLIHYLPKLHYLQFAGTVESLTHSILTAKQFFPGFLELFDLFFNFLDLSMIATLNSHPVLHKETLKQH